MKNTIFLLLLLFPFQNNKVGAQSRGTCNIEHKGEMGEAERLAGQRIFREPFISLSWLRADLTNETASMEDKNGSSIWFRPLKIIVEIFPDVIYSPEERSDSVKSVFVFDAILCKKIQNK